LVGTLVGVLVDSVLASSEPGSVLASSEPDSVLALSEPDSVLALSEPDSVLASSEPDSVLALSDSVGALVGLFAISMILMLLNDTSYSLPRAALNALWNDSSAATAAVIPLSVALTLIV
jgi:hypothetical protein